jgi:hypothetical protein
MKLNAAQVKQTLRQLDAEVVPEDHPAVTELTDVFGDHTFFLDDRGLKVLEPAEMSQTDATLTSLKPHVPEQTGTIIVFREVKH